MTTLMMESIVAETIDELVFLNEAVKLANQRLSKPVSYGRVWKRVISGVIPSLRIQGKILIRITDIDTIVRHFEPVEMDRPRAAVR
jgi:hypothetical protein